MTNEMPIGTVLPWFKSITSTPTLVNNWVECDGVQKDISLNSPYADGAGHFTPPDLRGKWLRGAATSGGTGGTSTHSHTIPCTSLQPGAYSYYTNESCGTTTTVNHIPPSMSVVWIMKVL